MVLLHMLKNYHHWRRLDVCNDRLLFAVYTYGNLKKYCRKLHLISVFHFAKIAANITKIMMNLLMRTLVQIHDNCIVILYPRPNHSLLSLKSFPVSCRHLQWWTMDPHCPVIRSSTRPFHALLYGFSTAKNNG